MRPINETRKDSLRKWHPIRDSKDAEKSSCREDDSRQREQNAKTEMYARLGRLQEWLHVRFYGNFVMSQYSNNKLSLYSLWNRRDVR